MINNADDKITKVFEGAREIFMSKMFRYGPSWLGFSDPGFADQIFIKAYRFKTLMNASTQKVEDPPKLELYAIINYCLLFLIARNKDAVTKVFPSPYAIFNDMSKESGEGLGKLYETELTATRELQRKKDHDYGSAWMDLSMQGIADMMLAKVLRLKTMLGSGESANDDHDSDGVAANLHDLINYAAFAIILLREKSH